ncbi:acetyl-coenzyme A synthetase 2-like%2C mitochondrial, partial [Scomber scombrus]
TVQRLRISQFYGAPTALRLLLKYDESWVKKYDRSSLRTLGSVGEPINHEAWHWFHDVVGEGRCPLVDTWWQTETGGVCIAPRPAEEGAPIIPAMAMRPFFGIQPALMGEKGDPLSGNSVSGSLVLAQPWPGMARTIYRDHQRFLEAYFKPYPGFYCTGDGAYRSEDGFYQITGRMDDVINVSGHRLGTAEIEDALDEHPDVPETAVIGIPHDLKGEVPFAFVVLKEGSSVAPPAVLQQLRHLVASKIAKYAVPEHFLVVARLPKTRSGKIMRRILRKVAMETGGDLGDVSTLDDPCAQLHYYTTTQLHYYTTTTQLHNYTATLLHNYYTTTQLHSYTTTQLHSYTTTQLHNYTLLHNYTTTLLHYYTTTLLHSYTTTQLHNYTATLLHNYTTTQLHYYTTTQLHSYTTTQLHYYTTTQLHNYTATQLHNYTTTQLHSYTKQLHNYYTTTQLHYTATHPLH